MKYLMILALVALTFFPVSAEACNNGASLFGGQSCGVQQQFAAVPMYGVQQQVFAAPMYQQQQVFAAPMFGYGVAQQPVIVNQRFGFNRGFGFRRRGFGRGFGLGFGGGFGRGFGRGFGNRQFGLFNFSF